MPENPAPQPRKPARRKTRARKRTRSRDEGLPGFELLAAPETIADPESPPAKSRRKRPAKRIRSKPPPDPQPQSQSSARTAEAPPTAPQPTAQRAPSLDAEAARQLAREARARAERIRDELERERRALSHAGGAETAAPKPTPPTEPVRPDLDEAAAAGEPTAEGWRTLPLDAGDADREGLLRRIASLEEALERESQRRRSLEDRLVAESNALQIARAQLDIVRRQGTEWLQQLAALDAGRPDSDTATHAHEKGGRPQPRSVDEAPPAIFDAWLDEQIARQGAALGHDGLAGLAADALSRRIADAGDEARAVVLGPGATRLARTLADDVERLGVEGVRWLALEPGTTPADPDATAARIESEPMPESPEALIRRLRLHAPGFALSRQAFSRRDDPAPWLEVVAALAESGCDWLLAERLDCRDEAIPDAVLAAGERIWRLLPARYRQPPGEPRPASSWREALARCEAAPGGLDWETLRERLPLEWAARAGCLGGAFLDGPTGRVFDPRAASDRRFLAQLSELDERRIESGLVRGRFGLAWIRGASAYGR